MKPSNSSSSFEAIIYWMVVHNTQSLYCARNETMTAHSSHCTSLSFKENTIVSYTNHCFSFFLLSLRLLKWHRRAHFQHLSACSVQSGAVKNTYTWELTRLFVWQRQEAAWPVRDGRHYCRRSTSWAPDSLLRTYTSVRNDEHTWTVMYINGFSLWNQEICLVSFKVSRWGGGLSVHKFLV